MTGPLADEQSRPPRSTTASNRDQVKIIHKGRPPSTHSPLAEVLPDPEWPDDLWTTGTLIYHVHDATKCLPPARTATDLTLRFDSHFESGNLERAYRLTDTAYHLIVEPDASPSALCQWFYFAIRNARSGTSYQFYLSGFHKESNLFGTGAKIFYYTEQRAEREGISWSHGGSHYAWAVTHRTAQKQKRATLQFRLEFPFSDDVCYIAYALPYTYTDLQRSIAVWAKTSKPGFFRSETLCRSLCGRDVPVLTLTSPTSPIPLAGRSCIFLTGRIHPGESNCSFVLHGLVDFLLAGGAVAAFILDHCIVRIVPMISVDGVVEGSYRIFSASGCDLNRMWKAPSEARHPVVFHTKELIRRTAMERPIVVYIDFHGHSRKHGTFAFGCPNRTDMNLKDAEKTLPRLFAFLSDMFSWEHCVFSFPKERNDAGRIVVRREMGVVQSFTIETSFGACKAGRCAGMLYDEALWKEVGSGCCEAIYHYLIPAGSPLVSYVNMELAYFAPKVGTRVKASKGSEESDQGRGDVVPVKFAQVADDIDAEWRALPKGEKRPLVRVRAPNAFLVCTPEILGVRPPEKVLPVWGRMTFSVRT